MYLIAHAQKVVMVDGVQATPIRGTAKYVKCLHQGTKESSEVQLALSFSIIWENCVLFYRPRSQAYVFALVHDFSFISAPYAETPSYGLMVVIQ